MMGKGQTIVIQFLIFFLIGFSLFLTISSFFKYQLDSFRRTILSSSNNLTNSYISSAIICLVDACKQCDFVRLNLRIQNTSAGYPIKISLNDVTKNLETSIPLENIFLIAPIHNLNTSISEASGLSLSAKTIILTFNKTNNKLTVG